MNINKLKNNYFALRHGFSQANEAKLIISSPEEGTARWALTHQGREQAQSAFPCPPLDKETLIITSDFTRARETAEIAAAALNSSAPEINIKLRERFFGNYDKQTDSLYPEVWKEDKLNNDNCAERVESPSSVAIRTSALIEEIESRESGKNILLVSHGDALQILQTVFAGIPPKEHRSLPHLNTGEVRKLSG